MDNLDHVETGGFMTSGDIARLMQVDLKTVHSWVKQGHLMGRRTPGGHLRFLRPEVVRFLRAFGYIIPVELGELPPRVALVAIGSDKRVSGMRLALRSFSFDHFDSLFDAVMAVGGGDYEVVALQLERYSGNLTAELVESLRTRPQTSGMALLGVSRSMAVRQFFLDCGGDLAINDETELRAAVRWLTGSGAPPGECEMRLPLAMQ